MLPSNFCGCGIQALAGSDDTSRASVSAQNRIGSFKSGR
jgi:hypothetical protein